MVTALPGGPASCVSVTDGEKGENAVTIVVWLCAAFELSSQRGKARRLPVSSQREENPAVRLRSELKGWKLCFAADALFQNDQQV